MHPTGSSKRPEGHREAQALTRTDGLRDAGRSVSALAAGEAINKGTRFVAAVLLARALDLGDFGLVNVGIAISGVLLSLTALGLPEFGAREVAVAPDRARHTAGLVLITRMAALGAASTLLLVATLLLASSEVNVVVLAAIMAVGLSGSADWLLRGREQMTDVAVATAVGGIVVLVGCASFVLLHPTVNVALSVFALGEGAAALMTWRRARVGRPEPPAGAEVRHALRSAWPLGASGLIIYAAYANVDTILLAAVRSEAEAGLYSAPYRLFLAANAVPLFAAYALLPTLARAHQEGRTLEGRRLLLRAFVPLAGYGMLLLGLAEATGGALLSGLFGEDFADARSILILLCIALPWYAIGFPAGYGLISEQRNRSFLSGAAVAGSLNFLLMAFLIPGYGGRGAAIATAGALFGAALVWIGLAGLLRAAGILCVVLAVFSFGGLLSVLFVSLAGPIGVVTGVAGLAMVIAPMLARALRRGH